MGLPLKSLRFEGQYELVNDDGYISKPVGVGDSSPTSGPVVQRLARPSGIRETRGSIPGLAFSFLLPQNRGPPTQMNS